MDQSSSTPTPNEDLRPAHCVANDPKVVEHAREVTGDSSLASDPSACGQWPEPCECPK